MPVLRPLFIVIKLRRFTHQTFKSYLFKEINYAHIISLLLQGGSNTKIYHVIVKLTLFISNEGKQKIVEIISLILYVDALLIKQKTIKELFVYTVHVVIPCVLSNVKTFKRSKRICYSIRGKSFNFNFKIAFFSRFFMQKELSFARNKIVLCNIDIFIRR